LEEQKRKFNSKMKKKIILFFFSLFAISISAQITENIDYANPTIYEIGGITISGAKHLNDNALITISGLVVGEKIKIPGEDISSAINKLWGQGLFLDVNINIEKTVESLIFLNINVTEHSRLAKFKFKGKISKSDITTLKEKLKLIRGQVLTQNLINNSINTIKTFYIDKGFYNIHVDYLTTIDSTTINSKSLTFNINKGKKVKIKQIRVHGRNKIINSNKSLFALKNIELKPTSTTLNIDLL